MSSEPQVPPPTSGPDWHTLSAGDTAQRLQTDAATGLSAEEAKARLARHGRNEIPEGKRRGPLAMLLDQFADFMILVLIAAAVISGLVGEAADTIAIVVIVVLNAVIGFVQEYRAERALAALRQMAAPQARVLRGGREMDVDAAHVVPGDAVMLEAGNIIPADLRMVEVSALEVAEAALTGESQPVAKHTDALGDAAAALGDRANLAFKGTVVTRGHGTGLVVATGAHTELGRIAGMLASTEDVKTPLQKRLASFSARLAWVVLAICAIVFAVGLLRGEAPVLMFLTAVSLAVAAIPEALPAVVAISLAFGAFKMVKRQALVRRLPAVETLGSITYICSDKTGTLTQNRMRAESFYAAGRLDAKPGGDAPWPSLFAALALCNDAHSAGGEAVGDPTEIALLEAALEAGGDPAALRESQPRLAEIAFDSQRKLMTTLHREGESFVAYSKGAPEALFPLSTMRVGPKGEEPLDLGAWEDAAEAMAAQGLRVLAVARRQFAQCPEGTGWERDFSLLGLVGLMDPPRPEARAAVEECRSAGIRPVMITGDHPATARAIAHRLGILDEEGAAVISGKQLAALSDEALRARVREVRVYARVDPAQKIRIVSALQEAGEFVAMTGDGVNDAPALKRADIGVAMGKGGTDVAREAAHMVLLDDNFATIVGAVREGRRIFDNIRKFIKYTMTSNSGEIWTIFLAPFLGLPIPLLPIHILWINLVTDGLPGLALSAEPAERGVMRRPPRPPGESIFAHGMWQHILWVGLLMGGVSLLTQAWAWHSGSAHWQSMVFTVLCLSQLGHAMAIRSERDSMFTQGIASNLPLLGSVALTVALQLATLYVPALNEVFHTEPLSAGELVACLLLSCVVFVAVEIEKWLVRNGRLYREPVTRG